MALRNRKCSAGRIRSRAIYSGFIVAAIVLSMGSLHAAGRQQLRDHVREAVTSSAALGRVAGPTRMSVAIGLPLRNEAELREFIQQVSDPASPNFQRYLTPDQFTERFGPTEADYQALSDFATGSGLKISGRHPNRVILDVSGTTANLERAFHINMMRWRHATRGEFYAPDREPSIDTGVKILDISGLDNFVLARPMDIKSLPLSQAVPLATGSGQAGLFIGKDFRTAYAPGVTLNGTGQSIGLFELDGFYSSDVKANFQKAGLAAVPVETVLLNGFSGAPGGANIEVTLDIMMAAYMAPGATKIIVYEGTIWNDVLNRMATDNLASQLSSSWCFSPTNATTEQIFLQMIAQGQSLFQASGDSGAYKGWIWSPADDPNLTVVGGTSLTTSGAGGPWQSETTWIGSGGGISTTWPIPSYQQSVDMAAIGGSATMRNIPDVAMTADVQMYLIQNNGQAVAVGGTSAAAPLWAGFLALANQQAKANGKPAVGFLNPLLYKLGAAARLQTDLHDISSGNNRGFNAIAGYDLATGWGSPAGQALIDDLSGVSNQPGFSLTSSVPTVSVAPGALGSSMITIAGQSGFSGLVNLAVSGLSAGVTAAFSPVTASSASTLTLSAGASASPGTSTLTISGTSGSLSSTTRLTLTVAGPPSFTLSAAPASASLPSGGTGSSAITVNAQNAFKGQVSLTVAGLPSGVTGSFSAVSATGVSTLALAASTAVVPGAWPLTVTGTSGSLSAKMGLSLTVTAAASFTLSAAPGAVSLVRGGGGSSTVAVSPLNGFAGGVALSVSGLPSGVTAAFGPAPAAGASKLTLTASSTAAVGSSTLTITGTSGSLASTAKLSLTVAEAPSFALSATPASLSVLRGASGLSTVTVAPLNGFASAVALSIAGLPAGVTATFNPASTTRTSSVTFAVSTSATLGQATVTVTGVAAAISAKTTIAFTVNPAPSFTLSASPASLAVSQGSSATSTISVVGQDGFKSAVGLTISGVPTGVTASFSANTTLSTTTLKVSATSAAAIGTTTLTLSGASGPLRSKATVSLTVAAMPGFTLSATPASLTIAVGSGASSVIAVNGQSGFSGAVLLMASGLPSGVTASFGAASATGGRVATFTVAATATPGTSTMTITGKSGLLSQAVAISLTLQATGSVSQAVSIASAYNVSGLVTDGFKFTSGGLDRGGRAYSANLLGKVQTVGDTTFNLGPANTLDAVSSATIKLPAGKYSSLKLLAAAVNGNQPAQTFTVLYSDGTTTSFTQSISDWCTQQGYAGETNAVPTTYRNNSDATRDNRAVGLFAYSFTLSSSKTVSAIALPKNANVAVLAVSLSGVAGANAKKQ